MGDMARQPRDLTQSEWFHVVQRGADRQDIFVTERDRITYETLLAEGFDRHGVEVHAYAWMSNHTHVLVRVAEGGSLSEAMHHLGSRYALAYNKATDRDGPLFTSRFHSTPVTSDAQLAHTARYIHRNPLAFVPAGALIAYRWSSLAPICGRRERPPWLASGTVAEDMTAAAYLNYVLTPQPADRLPLGNLAPLTSTSLEEILVAVSGVTNVPLDVLSARDPRCTELRTLVSALALELRAADSGEIALRLGLSDRRSVRRLARRGRSLLAESARFAALRQRVLDEIDAHRYAAA